MRKKRAPGTGSATLRANNRALLRVTLADGSRRVRTVAVSGSSKAEQLADAQRQLDNLVALLSSDGQLSPGGITLRGWSQVWLERIEHEQPRSVEAYGVSVRNQLWSWELADELLVNIRPRDVRALIRGLLRRYQRSTVSKAVSVLRMILEAAADDELIETNPAHGIRVPRQRAGQSIPARQPLARDELLALLESELPLSDRALIATAAICGLRSGEAHSMQLSHVLEQDGLLVLHVEFGGYGGKPTKNGKPRLVPVLPPALPILEDYLKEVPPEGPNNPEGLLFPNSKGKRRSYVHASSWLRYRLRLCGITAQPRFHDLRHTAGEALQNGWFGPPLAPEHVQAVLGHSSVTQTEAYTGGASTAMLAAALDIVKDHRRITGSSGAENLQQNRAQNRFSAKNAPIVTKSRFSDGSKRFDPWKILLNATEDLVASCAAGTATVAQVMGWRELVLAAEPQVFQRARALAPDPYLFQNALQLAQEIASLLRESPSAFKDGGGS